MNTNVTTYEVSIGLTREYELVHFSKEQSLLYEGHLLPVRILFRGHENSDVHLLVRRCGIIHLRNESSNCQTTDFLKMDPAD